MKKIHYTAFLCCLPSVWHNLRKNKKNVIKFFEALYKAGVSAARIFGAGYPYPLQKVYKGVYHLPYPLKKINKTFKYDIVHWNEEYWKNYKELLKLFKIVGIKPIVSFFDYCHYFAPFDRERSFFRAPCNLQNIEVLNYNYPSAFTYLKKLIKKQLEIVRGIFSQDEVYFEIANELFREVPHKCDHSGQDKSKWCSSILVRKIFNYLTKEGIKSSHILIPTGYKGGDYFHNLLVVMTGPHITTPVIPTVHLGTLKRRPPSDPTWNEKEWKNFLNERIVRYSFSTDGLDRGDIKTSMMGVRFAFEQMNKVGRPLTDIEVLEIMNGTQWVSEGQGLYWGMWKFVDLDYWLKIRKKIKEEFPQVRGKFVKEMKETLPTAIKEQIEEVLTPSPPSPPPVEELSWWQKILRFIKKLLESIFKIKNRS